MMNGHVIRKVWWCIFLLTAAAFFPLGLPAQDQTETVKHETGFYYTVQEGDTLWDISQKFFDDPYLWPDLWEKNSQLTNPHHYIYPGDVLHIYQRSGKAFIEKAVPAKQPPAPEPEPVEQPYFYYSGIEQVGFIRKPAVSPSGVIFKVQGDKEMASYGDTIYIRKEGAGTMPVGSFLTVYRTFGPVKNPSDKKETFGYQHYLTGIAEVTRVESDYVLATVIRSFRTIETGNLLMPYETRSSKIYLPENTPQISGTIVRSEEQTNLIGETAIAFIDKGEKDGVRLGQQYRVYYQEDVKLNPKDKKKTRLPAVETGTILVLHTEQNTATVLVITSKTALEPGVKFKTVLN